MQPVDYGVKNSFTDGEVALAYNTSKLVVLNTLLRKTFNLKEGKAVCLPKVLESLFKGTIDLVYTQEDYRDVLTLLGEPVSSPSIGEVKVIKSKYVVRSNKRALSEDIIRGEGGCCLMVHLSNNRLLVGASSQGFAVWLYFDNESETLNSGEIFIRTSSIQKIKQVCTFEVNPFIVSTKEEKKTIVYNPHWLMHTLSSMEAFFQYHRSQSTPA